MRYKNYFANINSLRNNLIFTKSNSRCIFSTPIAETHFVTIFPIKLLAESTKSHSFLEKLLDKFKIIFINPLTVPVAPHLNAKVKKAHRHSR